MLEYVVIEDKMAQIRLLDELNQWYQRIRSEVEGGTMRNRHHLNLFERGLERLRIRHNSGSFIKRKQHKKAYSHYSKKLGREIKTLWKLDLGSHMRMIYTTLGPGRKDRDIVCLIIDFIEHKIYNKIFGYK